MQSSRNVFNHEIEKTESESDTSEKSGINALVVYFSMPETTTSDNMTQEEELEPDASIDEDGFTVSRNTVQDAEPDIIAWLENLGYKK